MTKRTSNQPQPTRQRRGARSTGLGARREGLAEASALYRTGADGACAAAEGEESGFTPVQIFLSHKHKDRNAAKAIFSVLKDIGDESLEIFMSENIEKGSKWQDEIEEKLDESDWFLMLFSGTDDDWSWCHHEAGLFRGMKYPHGDRLVVIYPQSEHISLPDPLKSNQGVECHHDQPENVYRFFKDLFNPEQYPDRKPINPSFVSKSNKSIQENAKTIIDAVGGLVVRSITQRNTMTIEIPDVSSLAERSEFPPGTRILSESGALRLFEIGDGSDFSWSEFQDALNEKFRTCLNQSFWPTLYQACLESLKSRRLASTHTVVRSPADGRHYMPMLNRVEISGNNSVTFHITFVHVAAGTQADVRDKSVARVFTALRLAHRFRWEIIDPYRDLNRLQGFVEHQAKIKDRNGNGAAAANGNGGLSVVWEAIRLLEIESQNRGVSDPDALPEDFGPHRKDRVRKMFSLWEEQRRRLERAASDGDVANFSQVLVELDPINVEFISLASQRLGELVRADAQPQHDD